MEFTNTGHLTARSDVYGFGVVLLEMLVGRQAMDKSRPSQEYNLAEWARPLLIHNKKLLKIIDPRMEGQYTIETLQKVASLAYQCLSQNPKGRPMMNHVVETLESIQNLPESRIGMLLQSCGTAVTLYEFPKETGADQDEAGNEVHGNSRKRKQPTVRSKSEPPKELQLYSLSPDYEGHHPVPPCNGSAKPSIDGIDVHGYNV